MFYVRRLRVLLPVFLLALPLYAQQHDLTDADRAAIRTVIERLRDDRPRLAKEPLALKHAGHYSGARAARDPDLPAW